MPDAPQGETPEIGFRVDTHVFRELGAFLVGRDSTALAELIKNSYDADATDVWVYGENLGDEKKSQIVVTDNGIGMTLPKFRSGFLTIASREKSSVGRHTVLLGRRFTGAKGIGRLAAHKLARCLTVDSLPNPLGHDGATEGVHAVLDWDRIEGVQHVDELARVLKVAAITKAVSGDPGRPWGTRVKLARLRRAWTATDISAFTTEVMGYEPPAATYALNSGEMYTSPVFKSALKTRGTTEARPTAGADRNTFRIHLEGDFETGESWSPLADDAAQYVLEIDSSARGVRYGVARTAAGLKSLPEALRAPVDVFRAPASEHNVYFQARVFMRAGKSQSWNRAFSGVRLYLEGFRVLPYGEPGDDWLGLDAQYVKRGRDLVSLGDAYSDANLFGAKLADEGLSSLPATGYIGAVFLTEDTNGGLEMLVNREGFVPGPAFDELTQIVRRGLDLSTRIRAQDKAARSRKGKPSNPVTRERSAALAEQVNELKDLVNELTTAERSDTDSESTALAVLRVSEAVTEVTAVTADLLDELNMIRVLASVGMQLSAFVHELRGLLGVANQLQMALGDAKSEAGVPRQVVSLLDDLRRGLERQASFLDDVTSMDARRRRSAQHLSERVRAATVLLSDTARRRHVQFNVDVADTVRTRPMFKAELMAILANLLTNAVRAATPPEVADGHRLPHAVADVDVDPGIVSITTKDTDDGLEILISNTGKKVNLAVAEEWFEPYTSTSTDTDTVLGKGTGLGLTITRALVSENAGTLQFVEPESGYSTTIALRLPHKRSRLRVTT